MFGDGDGDDDPFEDPFEESGRSESSLGPDIPEVDVPSVDVPSVETSHDEFDADVDPELRQTFWRLVVVFDVALLALSLGPMFVYFRGDWATGGPLFALGAVSFAYGVFTYRRYRADDGPDEPDAVGE